MSYCEDLSIFLKDQLAEFVSTCFADLPVQSHKHDDAYGISTNTMVTHEGPPRNGSARFTGTCGILPDLLDL
jgi:hypothetical protein